MGLRFLLAGALLAASTGCGSPERPTSVDVEALEAAIPASLVPEHPEAVTVVVCPEIAVDGLGPVSCTAIVAGVDVLVKVTRPDRLDQMEVSAAVSLVRATRFGTPGGATPSTPETLAVKPTSPGLPRRFRWVSAGYSSNHTSLLPPTPGTTRPFRGKSSADCSSTSDVTTSSSLSSTAPFHSTNF